jgi:hypothetical protein
MKCALVPLYDVYVYFANQKEDVEDFIRSKSSTIDDDLEALERCRGECLEVIGRDGSHCNIMMVFDGDLDTVVHESVHMASRIMLAVGIGFARNNEETVANLAGWCAVSMLRSFPGCFKHKENVNSTLPTDELPA